MTEAAQDTLDLTAYRRVSSEGQVLEGYGLPVQKSRITGWAAGAHHIVGWEDDPGVTGTVDEAGRPGILAVLKAIERGDCQGVVITDLGRLSRLLTVQEAILAKVWSLGGRVFTVESGEVLPDDADDPMRTAMRQMAGVFFELERKMLLKRLRNGRAEKQRQGGFIGGGVAYGRRVVDGEFVPDEAELAVIARVRELRGEGKSLREVAAAMEAEGHRTKVGTRWYPRTVQRMLQAS
jgi:DNA invertase Pin-like site-specific DNA recombinase